MIPEQEAPPVLGVRVTPVGPATVLVAVVGELDLHTVDQLGVPVRTALYRNEPAAIRIDLEHVDFIDVAGVRGLYALHTEAAGCDCVLTITNAPESTRWILAVLGLDDVFAMPVARPMHAEPGS